MKNFKTIILTTTALIVSLSFATAKSVDGLGSKGLNDPDFKLAVSAIVQDKICDLEMKRQAFSHIKKASISTEVPVSVLMILANRRADKIIANWNKHEGVPEIGKSVCSLDISQLARFGSFALSRVSMTMSDRVEIGKQAYQLRDLVVKYRVLKAAERAECFTEDRAYKAQVVSANFNKQIGSAAFDNHRFIYAAWKPEALKAVEAKAYGDLDTCELADRLLSKQR